MERAKFSLFFGRSIGHFISYGLGLLVIAVLLSKLAAPILCTESKQSQKPRTIEPSLNISPIEFKQQKSSAEFPDFLKEEIKKLNFNKREFRSQEPEFRIEFCATGG